MTKLYDFFGNEFTVAEINNVDNISVLGELSLSSLSAVEIAERVVVVSANDGWAKHAYMLEELLTTFRLNNYQRLESYYTREDITDKIPFFQKIAAYFEENAVSYNAHILQKNPEFVTLLRSAIEVLLDQKDEGRLRGANRDDINANQDPRMVDFYASIAAFDDAKRDDFNSLFILNRTMFYNPPSPMLTLPAKWEPNGFVENYFYQILLSQGQYRPFPHRNVMVRDLIEAPEDACMHSWGLDILYLLQEHYLLQGDEVNIFSPENNISFAMEENVKERIKSKMMADLASAAKGREVYEKVKKDVNLDNILKNAEQRILLLTKVLGDFKRATSSYIKPTISQSINDFCDEALCVGTKLAKCNVNDLDFKLALGKELTRCAHQHFLHQDKILRILADCVLIPLGIATGGVLLLAKKWMTGSYFFSTALTKRETYLSEAMQSLESHPPCPGPQTGK